MIRSAKIVKIVLLFGALTALAGYSVCLARLQDVTLATIVQRGVVRFWQIRDPGADTITPTSGSDFPNYTAHQLETSFTEVDVRANDLVKVEYAGIARGKCYFTIYETTDNATLINRTGGLVGWSGDATNPEITIGEIEWRPFYIVGFWRASTSGRLRFQMGFSNYRDPDTGRYFTYSVDPPSDPHEVQIPRMIFIEIIN